MGAVFLVEEFTGTLLEENQEGTLEFIPLNKLDNLPLFEGDKAFLSKVFDKEESLFHAFLSYENQKFLHGRCTRQEDVEEFNTHAAGDVSFN
jgi:8-oxo-dGTP diphosphatase